MKAPPLPIVRFTSQEDWDQWLDEHHATSPGVWIQLAKKGSGIDSVTYPQAVEVALCHGWIDGQSNSFEEPFWLQKFTRRTARSKWSKRNCLAVDGLIAAGKMKPTGLREIELAKQDGRWERAYESPRNITVPADLQAQLDTDPVARDFFATLSGSNRYAILYRIQDAKKPETRARRIEKFLTMLREKKTVY